MRHPTFSERLDPIEATRNTTSGAPDGRTSVRRSLQHDGANCVNARACTRKARPDLRHEVAWFTVQVGVLSAAKTCWRHRSSLPESFWFANGHAELPSAHHNLLSALLGLLDNLHPMASGCPSRGATMHAWKKVGQAIRHRQIWDSCCKCLRAPLVQVVVATTVLSRAVQLPRPHLDPHCPRQASEDTRCRCSRSPWSALAVAATANATRRTPESLNKDVKRAKERHVGALASSRLTCPLSRGARPSR